MVHEEVSRNADGRRGGRVRATQVPRLLTEESSKFSGGGRPAELQTGYIPYHSFRQVLWAPGAEGLWVGGLLTAACTAS